MAQNNPTKQLREQPSMAGAKKMLDTNEKEPSVAAKDWLANPYVRACT